MSQVNTAKKAALMPRFVADDNGYASHKLAWYDAEGMIRTQKFDSVVSVVANGSTDTSGKSDGLSYKVEGVTYSCKRNARDAIEVRNKDYPVSVANRVLFTHALSKVGLIGMPIRAAVTLPFRDYFNSNGMMNDQLKIKTTENFSNTNVEVIGVDVRPEILSVNVYAEALSAWYDWALDDNGGMRDEAVNVTEDMAVIDIGGSTTDICSMRIEVHILLYTCMMIAVTLLPFVIHMSGLLYLACAVLLGARFLFWAVVLYRNSRPHAAIKTFRFSIIYLFELFIALLADHYLLLNI